MSDIIVTVSPRSAAVAIAAKMGSLDPDGRISPDVKSIELVCPFGRVVLYARSPAPSEETAK